MFVIGIESENENAQILEGSTSILEGTEADTIWNVKGIQYKITSKNTVMVMGTTNQKLKK